MQRMRARVPVTDGEAPPSVLVACSGGVDSVALAAIAHELDRLQLIKAFLGHVHHGQHQNANAAATAVERIGETLNMPVQVVRLSHEEIDAQQGVGLEEALRRLRYGALLDMADAVNATFIATAHHQRDQAETMLLHLMRGAGLDGVAGMAESSVLAYPWWSNAEKTRSLRLWRPLIGESHIDLERIAAASGLPVVDDPTNDEHDFRRNAVRHRVLPMLEEIAEGSIAAMARSASVLRRDSEALKDVEALLLKDAETDGGLSAAFLRQTPAAMTNRLIRRWLIDQGYGRVLSADRIEAIAEMAYKNRGGSVVELPGKIMIVLTNGILSLQES